MLTLEQMRKADPTLQRLSDEQLLALSKLYYSLAELALDSMPESSFQKSPLGNSPKAA
jgi:hypothetical protein